MFGCPFWSIYLWSICKVIGQTIFDKGSSICFLWQNDLFKVHYHMFCLSSFQFYYVKIISTIGLNKFLENTWVLKEYILTKKSSWNIWLLDPICRLRLCNTCLIICEWAIWLVQWEQDYRLEWFRCYIFFSLKGFRAWSDWKWHRPFFLLANLSLMFGNISGDAFTKLI